jgi:hypothetical protein
VRVHRQPAAGPRATPAAAPPAPVVLPNSVMKQLARTPSSASAPVATKQQRHAVVELWIKEMAKRIDEAKGGAHSADVTANERAELEGHRRHLLEAADNLKGPDFRDAVKRLTAVKEKELGVELSQDVVVKAGDAGWSTDDLGHVEDALKGLPGGWNPAGGKAITFAEVIDAADDTGGETDPDNTITMHRRGMGTKDYKDDCPSLKGLTRHQHSVRHEIGHTVHNRMRATADKLFQQLDWKEYAPANTLHRADLAAETGLEGAGLDAWIAGLGTTRTKKGNRTYMKAGSGLVHSFGKPDVLPTGHEWGYAYWSQSEYFAEVYSYLVDRPAFVAGALKKDQLDWWKDNVFGGTLPS